MKPAAVLLLVAAAAWAQPRRMECGVVYEGSISPSTPQQSFVFYAPDAGDAIAVRLVSTSDDRTFGVTAILTSPSGVKVQARGAMPFEQTRSAEFNLTEAGDYYLTVQAATRTATTGTFRVVRTRLKGPCGGPALGCGATARGAIGAPATINSYQFAGEAGDTFSVRFARTAIEDTAASFVVAVYDPAGQILALNEKSLAAARINKAGRLDVRLNARGMYTVLVFENSTGLRTGTYALGVMRLNGGCRTTAVACGSVVDAAITEPVEVDAYSVNAAAGDVYLLRRARTDGAMRIAMEVYDPQGNLVPPAPSSDASRYGFTASAPGAYTVLVSDDSRYDGALTGSYSVSLARLNRPCNARPLSCGSVVDGAVDGPMRSTAYSVSAQAGDVHLLRLLRGRTANGFRPRVEVYDPQGNQVQVASGDVARATFAAAVEGEYTILAGDGLDGTRTGTFSLALARLNRPCSATPLGCGTPARGNIDAPLQTGVYSYTAQAGESFTVRMLGATGDLQEALEVYDPKGNPAGVRVPGNAPGVDVPKPEPGVYTILAMNSSRAGGGAYLVQAFRTRGACAASAGQGATLTGVITGPAPFSALSMATAAGDSLLLRSASLTPGFNAAMDLYDADGIRVDSGTYMLSAQARAAGGYTVIFGGSDPRSTGRYAFSWQALNRPAGAVPLGCGQTVSGTLSPGGQFRWYRAGAADGDLLKLLLTPVSGGFRPQVELYDPGGKRLAGSGGEINRKAAGAGDYLILVSPSTAAGETGAFALALQEPNSACASLPLACGQTLLRAVDAAGQVDAFRFDASAGERIALRVPPRFGSFSPLLELYDPAGNLLQSGPVSQLTRTLTTAGPHMLLVRDRIGTNTGTYRVSLQHEPDACPVDDQEAPAVRLERPTGGEVAAGGTSFRISWQSDDNVDVTGHELRLSTDGCGTFPTLLAAGLGGATQSYDWQVPANVTPTRAGCIRVIATDAAGNSTSADSGPFALIGSGFEPNSTVTYEYDGANRLSRALYPDGTVVWYQYDSAGNLVQTVVTRPPAREAEGNGP